MVHFVFINTALFPIRHLDVAGYQYMTFVFKAALPEHSPRSVHAMVFFISSAAEKARLENSFCEEKNLFISSPTEIYSTSIKLVWRVKSLCMVGNLFNLRFCC